MLVVVAATMGGDSLTLWRVLFWLMGLEMVFFARSTILAMPVSILQNKYPLLPIQALLLAVALMCGRIDSKPQCRDAPRVVH